MGRINVGALQGNSPDFKVTLDGDSTLSTEAEVRVLGQSYHPFPTPPSNAFAESFSPLYPYTGVTNFDGTTLLAPWGTSAVRATTSADPSVTDSPVGGVPLKMALDGNNDPYTATYNGTQWNVTEAAAGEQWTFSVYVKSNQSGGINAQIFLFEARANGTYSTLSQQVFNNIGTSWQRISITRTFNQSDTAHLQVRVDGSDNGNANSHVLWWSGFQVNRGPLQDFTPDAIPKSEDGQRHDEEGYVRFNSAKRRLEVKDDSLTWQIAGGTSEENVVLPLGTEGDGKGFTVAAGANDTAHNQFTHNGMLILHEGLRYNDGASGDETLNATGNTRPFFDYISSTSSSDFAFHTGHTNPGNVSWPQFLAVKVSHYRYGQVLNRIRWYKHSNAIGNCNIWGTNREVDRNDFTDTNNWTFLGRVHFGGQGSGSEGGQRSQTFSNTNGYRWYMIEMVDINSSALTYPNIGTRGGWAMYGVTFDNT
jgi:hypothetical protein